MRKNNMDEPVLVGTKGFTPEAENILKQMGDVNFYPLGEGARSLTCCKPEVMLHADTDYMTWVDSDGFFVGNCSQLLIPDTTAEIHVRMRSNAENPLAFRGYTQDGEDGHTIPKHILEAWKIDIGENNEAANPCSCSACFLSVHNSARPFLQKWHEQMMKMLPQSNVGVVDRSLKYYHQLDESVLNSVLCFSKCAPKVTKSYHLDKSAEQIFIHFVGRPKPWVGWVPSSIRHFDNYVSVVEFAQQQNWQLPGPLPYSLQRKHHRICKMLQYPVSLRDKVCRKLRIK